MTDNEKIQKAERVIIEANALLSEVKALLNEAKTNSNNEEDIIAKYKNDYNEGRRYYLNFDGNVDWYAGSKTDAFEKKFNPYSNYITEELARQAKELKDFNDKLLAFKYCYDLDYKPDFSDRCDNRAYYVYYDSEDEEYYCDWDCVRNRNTVYFSSKEIAQSCADWLNSLSE